MRALLAAVASWMLLASPAGAAIVTNFTVGGTWFPTLGAGPGWQAPYGMTAQPSLSGTLTIDNSQPWQPGTHFRDGSAFLNLAFATGTKVWSLADIDIAQSRVGWWGSHVVGVQLRFLPAGNAVLDPNTAFFTDSATGIACNSCVVVDVTTPSNVPEPSTWVMLIVGFGLTGAVLRSSRRSARPA